MERAIKGFNGLGGYIGGKFWRYSPENDVTTGSYDILRKVFSVEKESPETKLGCYEFSTCHLQFVFVISCLPNEFCALRLVFFTVGECVEVKNTRREHREVGAKLNLCFKTAEASFCTPAIIFH